jgi:hypothetical protein
VVLDFKKKHHSFMPQLYDNYQIMILNNTPYAMLAGILANMPCLLSTGTIPVKAAFCPIYITNGDMPIPLSKNNVNYAF